MALVIPASVGGAAQVGTAQPLAPVQPIEERAISLVIPSTIGGDAQEPSGALPQISPFPEAREETRAVQELPELGQGGLLSNQNPAKIAAIAPLLLATTNNQEIASILQSNFPDIGISSDPGGNIMATNNATGAQVVINKPGLSRLDVLQGLGIASAFTPAARGATLAGGAAVTAGLGAKAALGATAATGAATSGLTQAAIEGLQTAAGGEFDESEIAIAATLGGAAELVLPAIQAVRQARAAKQAGVESSQAAAVAPKIEAAKVATEGLEEATGKTVGLLQAQKTLDPSSLLTQRLLPQLSAGSRIAAQALETQNKEAFDATTSLVNAIAPPEVVSTAAGRFRTAAQLAVEAGKARRRAATSPLFKEALDTGADVDIRPFNKLVADMLKDAPKTGKYAANIKAVSALINTGEKTAASKILDASGQPITKAKTIKPSLKLLQKAKFGIDEMIENFSDGALGATTKRDVVQLKKALVSQMEIASPLYKDANKAFADLSPAVKQLEDSIIGQVSKINDVNLKTISKKIFDASETNPELIKKTKAIIDDIDPGAWNDILRLDFQRRIGGIETLAEDLPGELAGNVPGQMRRAIFGNPEQRRTILAAMDTDQRKNFVYLDEVLKRASAGRAAGSPTTPFKEVLDKLRGVGAVLRDTIFRPLESLQKTGETGLFDRNVKGLTEIMFDPKWAPRMKELRGLKSDSPAAARAMAQLLKDATPEQEAE